MPYFIAIHPQHGAALWLIENAVARRSDGAQVTLDVPAGADALTFARHAQAEWTFHPLKLQPGQYYPRMARPNSSHPRESPGANPVNHEQRALIETFRGQLTALRAHLEELFRVVHPDPRNFATLGHEIRNLLILAATEVESH